LTAFPAFTNGQSRGRNQ